MPSQRRHFALRLAGSRTESVPCHPGKGEQHSKTIHPRKGRSKTSQLEQKTPARSTTRVKIDELNGPKPTLKSHLNHKNTHYCSLSATAITSDGISTISSFATLPLPEHALRTDSPTTKCTSRGTFPYTSTHWTLSNVFTTTTKICTRGRFQSGSRP